MGAAGADETPGRFASPPASTNCIISVVMSAPFDH
jgi:hypothetical protein